MFEIFGPSFQLAIETTKLIAKQKMSLRPQLLEKKHEDLLNIHQSYVELLMNIWRIRNPLQLKLLFIYFLRQCIFI